MLLNIHVNSLGVTLSIVKRSLFYSKKAYLYNRNKVSDGMRLLNCFSCTKLYPFKSTNYKWSMYFAPTWPFYLCDSFSLVCKRGDTFKVTRNRANKQHAKRWAQRGVNYISAAWIHEAVSLQCGWYVYNAVDSFFVIFYKRFLKNMCILMRRLAATWPFIPCWTHT